MRFGLLTKSPARLEPLNIMNNTERAAQESLDGLMQIKASITKQIIAEQAKDVVDNAVVGELLKQRKSVSDQILTEQWVQKLGHTIESNPATALPPSVGQGSLAQKLKNLQAQVKKGEHRDQRKSSTPPKDWAEYLRRQQNGGTP